MYEGMYVRMCIVTGRRCTHYAHGLATGPLFSAKSKFQCSSFSEVLATAYCDIVGRDSSVGIATRNELDGAGIKSRWGEIFHTRPDSP
jgi:hypothetical protein